MRHEDLLGKMHIGTTENPEVQDYDLANNLLVKSVENGKMFCTWLLQILFDV